MGAEAAAVAESIDGVHGTCGGINFNLGTRFSSDAGIEVRSRMTQTTSNRARRSATAPGPSGGRGIIRSRRSDTGCSLAWLQAGQKA